LDQQKTDAAGVEKCDLPVWLRMQELAANHLRVEFDALFRIADGNAEMRDAFDGRHCFLRREEAGWGSWLVCLLLRFLTDGPCSRILGENVICTHRFSRHAMIFAVLQVKRKKIRLLSELERSKLPLDPIVGHCHLGKYCSTDLCGTSTEVDDKLFREGELI